MPKVVSIGAIALLLSFSLGSPLSAKETPLILDSGIELKESRPNETTYYFRLQVGDKPLSQVIIDLPKGIEIQKWIDVVDANNRPVGSTYDRNGQQVLITFAKPIAIATKLNFYIHGMKAKGSVNLPILVKLEGNPQNQPIGTIRIKL